MSSPRVTVPPPVNSDHEDVAWALRAASAQWRREAHADAIAWVERAAETAEEVGAVSRSVELLQLAEQLRRGSLGAALPSFGGAAPASPIAVAPPPPPQAVAPPPPPGALPRGPSSQPSAGPAIEVDFEEEDVEFLDDDDEIVSLDEPDFDDGAPAAASQAEAPVVPSLDIPSLGGGVEASLGSAIEFGEATFAEDDDIEFGEVEFGTQAKPAESRSATPSVREIEPPSIQHIDATPFDLSTPAEIAMSQRPAQRYNENLEEELGIDLSLRLDGGEGGHLPRSRTEPRPSAPSVPATPEAPVGLAAVRPSRPPGVNDRIVSPGLEPFAEAPSAVAPNVEPYVPPIEPPSRPSQAPPAESMRDPGLESSAKNEKDAEDDDDFELPFSIPTVQKSEPPRSVPTAEAAPASVRPSVSSQLRKSSLPPKTGGTFLDGIDAMVVPGLMDLPEEGLVQLLGTATLHRLERGEEVSSFAVALVTSGAVQIMPSIADATCAVARKGEVIFTTGSLETGVELKVVGYDPGTRVATMSKAAFDSATAECPWVVDELAEVADRFQAFAGAVLGPLGDSLDDMFRGMVLDKCIVKRPRPQELIATKGKPVNGFYVVGAGSLEVLSDSGEVTETLAAGDFVFPETILSASPARASVRAAQAGALLLYIDRMGAHELLATCPPFIELLAG